MSLTAARLRELLHYDAQTGAFTWLAPTSKRMKVGDVAGYLDRSTGHVRIEIDGKNFYAHRLAWLYMTGGWPSREIDHINGIKSDARYKNLRDVTHAVNTQNLRRAKRNNRTGALGVHLRKKGGMPRAVITTDGKKTDLGSFDTVELAHQAYITAKRQHHKGCTI